MRGTLTRRRGVRFRMRDGVVIGAALAVLVGAAGAGWDGEQTILLGDKMTSSFAAEPGAEVHRYHFYANKGATLKARMAVNSSGDLLPAWQVLDAAGGEVPLGGADRGTVIKNFKFSEGGPYTLQLTATSGTGGYTLKTAGSKLRRRYDKKRVDSSFTFEGIAGQKLTARLQGGKQIASLLAPSGAEIPAAAGKSSIRNLRLTSSGVYTLTFEGVAKRVIVKLKNRKMRSWYFDAVETDPGQASLAREQWMKSAHADMTAEAFRHWDVDGSISTRCAACHSSGGFQDFLGADGSPSNVLGSPANMTDENAALGTTVDCDACHNSVTERLSTVQFPSGAVLDGLGPEARCMQCHQGRESGVSLAAHIAAAEPVDDDTANTKLSFKNIHYFAAGASLYGNQANGAFQYENKIYNNRFPHVSTIDDCQECHDQHTLELRYEACESCHNGADAKEKLLDIRHVGSVMDYDADGRSDEGLYYELETMAEKIYVAMQQYAAAAGAPIAYDSHSYPYFFNDSDGSGGFADPGEANFGNKYSSWTPRLLRAAYNYQYWQKDPGSFAHNGKYMIEVLYDTLESLNEHASVTVAGFDEMHRNDTGHFDNTARAFRYWDSSGSVRSSCAQCHSPDGFQFTVDFGIAPVTSHSVGDGFSCEQCHTTDSFTSAVPATRYVDQVTFPSGVQIKNDPSDPDDSFLCMTCHQGRESKTSVDETIANAKPGDPLRFKNIHYLAAGPSLYGSDAGVGYEYDDRDYAGKFRHRGGRTNSCSFCHLADHTFEPKLTTTCTNCHIEADGDIEKIRLGRDIDYDGDGSIDEKLKDEVASFAHRLWDTMQDYAAAVGQPELVNAGHYPYFETTDGESYPFDPPMLRAIFNYQMWSKEPGAWAHNTDYILQLLYDSIEDLQLEADANGTPIETDHLSSPDPLTRPTTDE